MDGWRRLTDKSQIRVTRLKSVHHIEVPKQPEKTGHVRHRMRERKARKTYTGMQQHRHCTGKCYKFVSWSSLRRSKMLELHAMVIGLDIHFDRTLNYSTTNSKLPILCIEVAISTGTLARMKYTRGFIEASYVNSYIIFLFRSSRYITFIITVLTLLSKLIF